MAQLSFYQALTIYAWFPLAFTLAVLMLIARFYERFSSARTFWRLYSLPIIGYAVSHVREAALGMPGDPFSDGVQTVSGVLLLALTVRLSMLMLREKEAAPAVSPPLLVAGGAVGEIALGVALFMFGRYTRRMVLLNRQPPYHHSYYIAAIGMLTAAGMRLVDLNAVLMPLYPLVIAASMTLGAVVSWRSWSWLLVERA